VSPCKQNTLKFPQSNLYTTACTSHNDGGNKREHLHAASFALTWRCSRFLINSQVSSSTLWILDLCNGIVKEGSIPEDCKSSVVLPIYKGKGDPMECGSYRGIKLLEHAMKVVERIFEYRIRQHIEIDGIQFGFMKGKGTTDAIFMARQMQENLRVKGKKLYFGFVDLEKAFDRVPREVISWAIRKLEVEEWLVSAVMSMYTGVKTIVRTVYGNSKGFEVKVGMHQVGNATRATWVPENPGKPDDFQTRVCVREKTRI